MFKVQAAFLSLSELSAVLPLIQRASANAGTALGVDGERAFHNPVTVVADRRYAHGNSRLAAIVAGAYADAGRTCAGYLRDGALSDAAGDTGIAVVFQLIDALVQVINVVVHLLNQLLAGSVAAGSYGCLKLAHVHSIGRIIAIG